MTAEEVSAMEAGGPPPEANGVTNGAGSKRKAENGVKSETPTKRVKSDEEDDEDDADEDG